MDLQSARSTTIALTNKIYSCKTCTLSLDARPLQTSRREATSHLPLCRSALPLAYLSEVAGQRKGRSYLKVVSLWYSCWTPSLISLTVCTRTMQQRPRLTKKEHLMGPSHTQIVYRSHANHWVCRLKVRERAILDLSCQVHPFYHAAPAIYPNLRIWNS